ncbi:MAG TPA: M23 family metallopeptidase, partial [Candidatus Baltobacteraceae bacterium]|nr:M23 family metallopeptidase [Candidatus Baltobacteraceae bacterium]
AVQAVEPAQDAPAPAEEAPAAPEDVQVVADLHEDAQLVAPISDALSRVTKKPFGIEIHPETSPVPGDKFNGFHVGVDFETFPEEQDIDVPISAACAGPLLFKKQAQGYGGVAVQRCVLDGRSVSVIYGHMRLSSIEAVAGDRFIPGQRIGVLGTGYSAETNGVRKHLHFGIRDSATSTDIRGYVPKEEDEAGFLDALDYMVK